MKELGDGSIEFERGKEPLIISYKSGEVGMVIGYRLNMLGNFDISIRPPKFSSKKKAFIIKNVPQFLLRQRGYIKYSTVHPNGVWLVGTSFSGRNYLKAQINFEQQKIVLMLKREIEILNSGLLHLTEIIPENKSKDFYDYLGEMMIHLQTLNKSIFGDNYDRYLTEGKYNALFKSYLQLGSMEEVPERKEWESIVDKNIEKFDGGVFNGS